MRDDAAAPAGPERRFDLWLVAAGAIGWAISGPCLTPGWLRDFVETFSWEARVLWLAGAAALFASVFGAAAATRATRIGRLELAAVVACASAPLLWGHQHAWFAPAAFRPGEKFCSCVFMHVGVHDRAMLVSLAEASAAAVLLVAAHALCARETTWRTRLAVTVAPLLGATVGALLAGRTGASLGGVMAWVAAMWIVPLGDSRTAVRLGSLMVAGLAIGSATLASAFTVPNHTLTQEAAQLAATHERALLAVGACAALGLFVVLHARHETKRLTAEPWLLLGATWLALSAMTLHMRPLHAFDELIEHHRTAHPDTP